MLRENNMDRYEDIYGILALGGLQQMKDDSKKNHCSSENKAIKQWEYGSFYVEVDPFDYISQMLWEVKFL